MANVMQQNGQQSSLVFLVRDLHTADAQRIQCFSRQVHRSDGVIEAAVYRPGIHQVRHSQLSDASQTLENVRIDQIQNDPFRNLNKSVYRIVDDFTCGQGESLVVSNES